MMNKELFDRYANIVYKGEDFSLEEIEEMAEVCEIYFKNPNLDEKQYNLALVYLSLHELTVAEMIDEGESNLSQAVTSEKADGLARTYSNINQDDAYYSRTPWGAKFLEIIKPSTFGFFVSPYEGD